MAWLNEEITILKDEGRMLIHFKELRELLWQRLPDEPRFTDETLFRHVGASFEPVSVSRTVFG